MADVAIRTLPLEHLAAGQNGQFVGTVSFVEHHSLFKTTSELCEGWLALVRWSEADD